MATSGTYTFAPALADMLREAYERIQVRPNAITIDHIVSGRMSMNLILTDWSGNVGVNLANVDQISVGLVSGRPTYSLPSNTIDLLDCYLRTFTESTSTTDLGTALTAMTAFDGSPMISTPYGDVTVSALGSGTLSCVAGSPEITMAWASHGLSVGGPVFFGSPISIGGVSYSGLAVATAIPDGSTLRFNLPYPVQETQVGAGGTPLFYTQSGSGTVICILPGHGLKVGSTFTVPISTTVGGLTLSGTYTVTSVQALYQFSFAPGGTASSTAVKFENDGKIRVATQSAGVAVQDIPVFPMSRNDYANIPVKAVPGQPSSFWLNRTAPPEVSLYPVPDGTADLALVMYRMRRIQDANPVSGQQLDMSDRAYEAFISELAAKLAEKWNRPLLAEKRVLADAAWTRFASSDVERAIFSIKPNLGAYYE